MAELLLPLPPMTPLQPVAAAVCRRSTVDVEGGSSCCCCWALAIELEATSPEGRRCCCPCRCRRAEVRNEHKCTIGTTSGQTI